jgi:DNA-binding PadR family transcriptional regulator
MNDRSTVREPESYLPLPPASFEILVALAGGERHGYAIMQEVAERTGGSVRLGPGTLYGSLKRLLADELVVEGSGPAAAESGEGRRRYYRLTSLGLAVARAEARRMEAMVRAARRKKLLSGKPA